MPKAKNLFEIHIGVLLFGLAGLFGKLLNLPSTVIVFGRVLFASMSLFLILVILKQSLKLNQKRDYSYLLLLGVLLAIHWITFFESIQLSTVAIGLLTFSTFPIFAAFLEPLFFREKLHGKDLSLALITLIGVALVIPKFELGNNVTQGAIWGIVSGATFAILSILNRKFVKDYSNYVIAFYQDLGATLILIPFLFFLNFTVQTNDILLLILLGVVFTGLSHSFFINGLKTVKAKTASIIATLEPVYGIIAAALLLNEVPTFKVLIGGLIILSATIYETISSKNIR